MPLVPGELIGGADFPRAAVGVDGGHGRLVKIVWCGVARDRDDDVLRDRWRATSSQWPFSRPSRSRSWSSRSGKPFAKPFEQG